MARIKTIAVNVTTGERTEIMCTPEEEAALIAAEEAFLAAMPQQIQAETVVAIQNLLDSTARKHGYDDLRSTITYIGSSVVKWNNEGLRARAWRDECWWKAYEIQEAVKAGTRPLPTVQEVLAEMPPANWPAA